MARRDEPRSSKVVRIGLLVLTLVFGALCCFFFTIGGFLFFSIPLSTTLAWFLLGCGSISLLFLLISYTGYQLSKSSHQEIFLWGVFLSVVIGFLALSALELRLARYSPAPTWRRVVSLAPGYYFPSNVVPAELAPGFKRHSSENRGKLVKQMTVNSHGFRGKEFDIKKPSGVIRILVVGDSYALNDLVSDSEVFTEVLERRLKAGSTSCQYEVLNGGMTGGYSADSYSAFMIHRGFDLSPDIVIMQFSVENDLRDLLENKVSREKGGLPARVRSLYREVDGSGHFRRKDSYRYKVPFFKNSHIFIYLHSVLEVDRVLSYLLPAMIPEYVGDYGEFNSIGFSVHDPYLGAEKRLPAMQQALERSVNYLRGISAEAKKRDIQFIVFPVPSPVQVKRELWPKELSKSWDNPSPQAEIREGLGEDSIKIIASLQRFRELSARGEKLFTGGVKNRQWTVEGNAFVADVLYDYLLNQAGLAERKCESE